MAKICPVCNNKVGFFEIQMMSGTRFEELSLHPECEPKFLEDPEKYGGKKHEKSESQIEDRIEETFIEDDYSPEEEITYQGDEQYYLKATEELDSGEIDDAMWVKAMTLSQGDETKARYQYIELKAKRLNGFSRDPSSKIKIETGVYKFSFWIVYIIFIIVSWISFTINLPVENFAAMVGQLIGAGLTPLVLSGVVQFISNKTIKPEYPKRMWWKILTWITTILLIGNLASV